MSHLGQWDHKYLDVRPIIEVIGGVTETKVPLKLAKF